MDENSNQNPAQKDSQQAAADIARAKLVALYGQGTSGNQGDNQPPEAPNQPVQPAQHLPQSYAHQANAHPSTPPSKQNSQYNLPGGNQQRVVQPPAPDTQAPNITELYAREQLLQSQTEHLNQDPIRPDHQLPGSTNGQYRAVSSHAAQFQRSDQKSANTFAIPSASASPNAVAPVQSTPQQQPQGSESVTRQQQIANHSNGHKKGDQGDNKLVQKWRHFMDGDDIVPGHGKSIRNALIASLLLILFYNHQFIYGQVNYYISPGDKVVSPLIIEADSAQKIGEEPRVVIPKINVDVPLVYDITSWEDADVQKGLQRGVVHYGTTALPGQIGNNVIVGHSSNSVWSSGQYKFAFVLLDQLNDGDTFIIDYKGERYIYEVFKKLVIEPTDVDILSQDTGGEPITTLITCTPPGTAWRRLVVQARQISPNPLEAKKGNTTIDTDVPIPGDTGGESLLDSVTNWFN